MKKEHKINLLDINTEAWDDLPHYSLYLNSNDIHNNYYRDEEEENSDYISYEEDANGVSKNFNEDFFI